MLLQSATKWRVICWLSSGISRPRPCPLKNTEQDTAWNRFRLHSWVLIRVRWCWGLPTRRSSKDGVEDLVGLVWQWISRCLCSNTALLSHWKAKCSPLKTWILGSLPGWAHSLSHPARCLVCMTRGFKLAPCMWFVHVLVVGRWPGATEVVRHFQPNVAHLDGNPDPRGSEPWYFPGHAAAEAGARLV